MTKLASLKQRRLANPDVREEYARAEAEFSLIEAMIAARRTARRTSHRERAEQ